MLIWMKFLIIYPIPDEYVHNKIIFKSDDIWIRNACMLCVIIMSLSITRPPECCRASFTKLNSHGIVHWFLLSKSWTKKQNKSILFQRFWVQWWVSYKEMLRWQFSLLCGVESEDCHIKLRRAFKFLLYKRAEYMQAGALIYVYNRRQSPRLCMYIWVEA